MNYLTGRANVTLKDRSIGKKKKKTKQKKTKKPSKNLCKNMCCVQCWCTPSTAMIVVFVGYVC